MNIFSFPCIMGYNTIRNVLFFYKFSMIAAFDAVSVRIVSG